MSTRRQRKGALDAARTAGEDGAAASTHTAEPSAATPAAATSQKKAGKKRKEQPVKQEADADAQDNTQSNTGGSGTPKLNRRAAKKAKIDSEASAQIESARKAQQASLRSKSVKQRERKQQAKRVAKDEEEQELEAFLFGGMESAAVADEDAMRDIEGPEEPQEIEDEQPKELFQIDTTGGHAKNEPAVKEESAVATSAPSAGPAPAWIDEDDSSSTQLVDLSSAARLRKLKQGTSERYITPAEYSRRLRQVYKEMHPGAEAWAQVEGKDDKDLTQLLLQSSSTLTGGTKGNGIGGGAGRGEKLPSASVELIRMKDANLTAPSQSVVTAAKFHSQGQLFFTAGLDKMIRLFQIDGITNTKLQGVWLEDLPVHCASWLGGAAGGDGSAQQAEIIASGRRSYFYSIDISTNAITKIPRLHGREEKSLENFVVSPNGEFIAFLGNDGYIILVSGRSKQQIGVLKQNLSVRSLSFSPDSTLLFSIGGEGLVYIWDMHSRKCLYKHVDHGSISGTAIAIDPAGKGYYATGQDSGVVNLYNSSQLSSALSSSSSSSLTGSAARFSALSRPSPDPLKSFMNLTTPIDSILFNSDAQLMLIASRRKKDALRLVHVETQTVFQNWPTSSTPLHFVSCMDFSPNSGYMTIGNDRGRVLLYRLTHYPRA